MTISAKIIADSISPAGKRITTFQLRYPRFLHSEFMTHRMFSRNASSSRAIPVERMIEDLRRDPAMPVYWGSNKPGMQAGAELDPESIEGAKGAWLAGMEYAIEHAKTMMHYGLHKQIANRILEPWAHINVVVTATEWDNFYELRRHADAQPEIKVLADLIHAEMQSNTPTYMCPGAWHTPYVTALEYEQLNDDQLAIKVSVARCARVSYLTHDGRTSTIEEDLKLYHRLVGSRPLHASPCEHIASPDEKNNHGNWTHPEYHGNFSGWNQYRRQIENRVNEGI